MICKIAYDDFALNLDETKTSMVYRRLSPRLKTLGMPDFEQYAELLQTDREERLGLMSLLTTNLTSFFREQHHFDILNTEFMPDLVARARKGGRVRIWSAGCSTGQEPYSLAMSLLEACPEAGSMDIKLLGTDIDKKVVQTAKDGFYEFDRTDGIPPHFLDKYFEKTQAGYTALPSLRKLVSFGQLNLVGDWPFSGMFDVIFCRNVAIYFDTPTQAKVWKRFCEYLPAGGLLCIGHSERVSGVALDQVKSLGKTAYIRK